MGKTIQGNTWLCFTCAEVEPRHDLEGVELTNNWGGDGDDGDGGDGIRDFDNTPCGYCGTTLAGHRFRFAYWL